MIIIDAGHGGTDSGAYANGQKEKEWTLEATLYIDKRLGDLGIDSKVTRSTDITLDSKERTAIVRNSGADICLSNHFNAGGGEGSETIHSIYADNKLAKLIAISMEQAGMPNRRVFSRKGSHGDYYYMHRETGAVQTVIIEYGFLDSSDYNKLKDKSFRVKLYEAVVRAVCGYLGAKYQEVKKEPKKESKGLYKVQVGAFANKDNAERLAKELQDKGYATYIVQE